MNKISVLVLQEPEVNPVIMTTLAAKITQQKIKVPNELFDLMAFKTGLVENVLKMEHPNVIRHSSWTLAIFGASRRFLAQITRHKIGIDFTSASLQYQDMRNNFDPVVPYPLIEYTVKTGDTSKVTAYKEMCKQSFNNYNNVIEQLKFDNDTAGYVSCAASRNLLLVTANTEAWRNIIKERICNRNTLETQYVALKIWETLIHAKDGFFMFSNLGPSCMTDKCTQGKMSCKKPYRKIEDCIEAIQNIEDKRFPFISQYEAMEVLNK